MNSIGISPPQRLVFKGSYEEFLAAKAVIDHPTGFDWPKEAGVVAGATFDRGPCNLERLAGAMDELVSGPLSRQYLANLKNGQVAYGGYIEWVVIDDTGARVARVPWTAPVTAQEIRARCGLLATIRVRHYFRDFGGSEVECCLLEPSDPWPEEAQHAV